MIILIYASFHVTHHVYVSYTFANLRNFLHNSVLKEELPGPYSSRCLSSRMSVRSTGFRIGTGGC
jgi:hypothetical protein